MKKLYEFYWDFGRMGEVTGMIIAEEEDVASAIGKQIYFGEILGKPVHSALKFTDSLRSRAC